MMGRYRLDTVSSAPLNPMGRTGLKGKGLLPRWGPNNAVVIAMTRWSRAPSGAVIHRLGHPILQVLSLFRHKQFCLPWFLTDHFDNCDYDDCVPALLKNFISRRLKQLLQKKDARQEINAIMKGRAEQIFKGYMDDHLNADNAWIEAVVINVHESDNWKFSDAMLKVFSEVDSDEQARWMEVAYSTAMRSSHCEIADPANDDEKYREFAEMSQYITALVLYPIVSLVGMAGSVLCIVVLSQRQMLTSTNAYLIALAVADLMKLANDFLYFPATLLQMNASRRGGAVFAHLYPYAFFLSQYTSGCAAWLTVVVAGERFLMVTHPNWSRYTLTVRKSRIVSAITFSAVLLVTWPYLLRYETVCDASDNNSTNSLDGGNNDPANSTECTWKPVPSRLWSSSALASYSKYYVQCQSCLKSLVPLIILIVLNIRIVMAVRETRANKKLGLVRFGWGYTEVTSNFRRGVREISDLLLAVNSSVNFFLYVVFNKVFRQNLLALCCRSAAGPVEGRQQTAGLGCQGDGCSRAAAVAKHNLQKQTRDTTACGSSATSCAKNGQRHGCDKPQQQRLNRPAGGGSECIAVSGTTGGTALAEECAAAKTNRAPNSGATKPDNDFEFDNELSPQSWNFRRHSHCHAKSLEIHPEHQRLRPTGSNRRRCGSHQQFSQQGKQLLHHQDPGIARQKEAADAADLNLSRRTAKRQVEVVVTLVVHHHEYAAPTECDEQEERVANAPQVSDL
uniref:G_PROTEIN_RECEP_F1_2 domain-containing protein n=1 Tax=Macrostomum lignano TaxID=282301 RepID=A0A1I8IS91_9PLAT